MSEGKGGERKRKIVDADGIAVTPGCTIHFGYGIPPVGVDANVIERSGRLIALTPGHKPAECDVTYINRHFDFWVVPSPSTNSDEGGR